MAEITKAALETENAQLKEQVTVLAKQITDSPLSDDANYQKELTRLNAKNAKVSSEFEAFKIKMRDEKIERETIENDRKAAEERRMAEFGMLPSQNEHTRFRALPKPPSGQRDIFGDPAAPVFDIGIDFQGYYGGLYIPVSNVIEMAQSIGMLTADQANDLNLELSDTKAKIEFAGAFAQELVDGISTHVDKFYSNLSDIVDISVDYVSDANADDSDDGKIAGQTPDALSGKESGRVPNGAKSADQPDLFGNLK